MSMCPGRQWGDWSRNFDSDLNVILENKIHVIASIITHTELTKMNQNIFFEKIKNYGFESLEYSIHDKWLPNSVESFMRVIDQIAHYLAEDKSVLVHCNGGRGRTGLIVAGCLIFIGHSSDEAIQIVRNARSGMLRNPAQEVFLHAFQSKIQEQRTPCPSPRPLASSSPKKIIDYLTRRLSVSQDADSDEGSDHVIVKPKPKPSPKKKEPARPRTTSHELSAQSLPIRKSSSKFKPVKLSTHYPTDYPNSNPIIEESNELDLYTFMERSTAEFSVYDKSPFLLTSDDEE